MPDNRSAVTAVLPDLISGLDRAAVVLDGPERRRASSSLASAYGLAQHLAVDLVEPETQR
jgi:hypothetical protein